ncbi:AAA family ATPase [Lentzea guizhouensis]|uniref:AAA family ATPase n=1 Tax=Lentzea guizhouensis TaxID=1586287 RepID=UPI000A919528
MVVVRDLRAQGTTLADRLAAARDGALVGREHERAVLDRMLAGAQDAPVVAYLHGPGGIGKSSLLRYAARRAELARRHVVQVNARYLGADPRRLEEAAALACVQPGSVLLIDTFEHCQQLEAWLRDTVLFRLAEGALVVLASRNAPDVEWSVDPGWAQVFAELALRPLDAGQSDLLLAARGVPAEQRGPYVAFAGGSPLALARLLGARGRRRSVAADRRRADDAGGAAGRRPARDGAPAGARSRRAGLRHPRVVAARGTRRRRHRGGVLVVAAVALCRGDSGRAASARRGAGHARGRSALA